MILDAGIGTNGVDDVDGTSINMTPTSVVNGRHGPNPSQPVLVQAAFPSRRAPPSKHFAMPPDLVPLCLSGLYPSTYRNHPSLTSPFAQHVAPSMSGLLPKGHLTQLEALQAGFQTGQAALAHIPQGTAAGSSTQDSLCLQMTDQRHPDDQTRVFSPSFKLNPPRSGPIPYRNCAPQTREIIKARAMVLLGENWPVYKILGFIASDFNARISQRALYMWKREQRSKRNAQPKKQNAPGH